MKTTNKTTKRVRVDTNFKNEKRIEWTIKEKLAHFAPTISPARKNSLEIESLEEAIRYYHSKDVKQIIVQPKFMGSYVDIELHKELSSTRFFSRNGYLINYLDRNKLLQAVTPIHSTINWNDGITKYLIQSELLPWSAMGSGLITDEFKSYGKMFEEHLNYVKDSTIYDKIEALKNTNEYEEYFNASHTLSEKELNEAYDKKHHLKRTFQAVEVFNRMDVEALNEGLVTFKNQIDIFGGTFDNYAFKPFNLLKIYYENGEEFINDSNIVGYCMFNLQSQNFLILDFVNTELSECITHAYKYYNDLKQRNYEGVVVKPDNVYLEGIVPMYKVRHDDYLTMIYGIDFKSNFKSYHKKRSVGKKEKASINQWKISQALLRIKDSDINSENEYYKSLIKKRILSEEFEESIDKTL